MVRRRHGVLGLPTHRLRALISLASIAWLCQGYASSCSESVGNSWTYDIPLPPEQAALFSLAQPGVDVRLELSRGGDVTILDSPSTRYGPEFIFLEPSLVPYSVCAQASFAVSTNYVPDIQLDYLSSLDAEQMATLRLLNEAGAAWAREDQGGQQDAVDRYTLFADRLSNTFGDFDIEFDTIGKHARYYAALGAFARYDYEESLQQLDLIGAVPHPSHLHHSIPVLRARILRPSPETKTDAIDLLRQTIAAADQRYAKDIAVAQSLLGQIYLEQGSYDEGERRIDLAIDLVADDDEQLLGELYNNLGYVSVLKGRNATDADSRQRELRLSIDQHEIALAYAELAEDSRFQALILNNIGTIYERLGDLVMAQQHYADSLARVDGRSSQRSVTLVNKNLGDVYLRLGDIFKAEPFLDVAMASVANGETNFSAEINCSLGTVRRMQGRIAEAIELHNACRVLDTGGMSEMDDKIIEAEALLELALDFLAMNETETAYGHIALARNLLDPSRSGASEIPDTEKLWIRILANAAYLNEQLGLDRSASRADLAQALSLLPGQLDPTVVIDVLQTALETSRLHGDDARARALGYEALEQIEKIHAQLETERLSPFWAAKNHKLYNALIQIELDSLPAQRRQDPAAVQTVLNLLERSRAAGLRKSLAQNSAMRPADSNTEDRLKRLSEIANMRAEEKNQRDMAVAAMQYQQHEIFLAGQTDQTLLAIPEPHSLREIQAGLEPQQLVLYYLLFQDHAYLLEIAHDFTSLTDIGHASTLTAAVLTLRQAMASRATIDSELLGEVSRQLLPEMRARQFSELIIVPHRELHGLPFAMLRTPADELLIDRYDITLVPSLSTMLMEKGSVQSGGTDIAILADPLFGAQSDPGSRSGPELLRSWSETLERLPWTAAEADSLAGEFPDRVVKSYTGAAANRSNLFSDSSRMAQILHVASHGFFAHDSPDNVGFVLSSLAEDGSTQVGAFITLTDLASYDFGNELVVISGCETAVGNQLSGEGNISLSRAFLSKGAKRVMATLWPVSDRGSAEFMGLFYAELNQTGNAASALRNAQLRMQRNPRYSDPFYWAGYVLTSIESDQRIAI